MRKFFFLLALSASLTLGAAERLTAFPGADGFGKFTTGGRGGRVYHVTRLDDCTDTDLVEGTLRWALRDGDDTPRTIVFDTCGTIVLTGKLKFQHPNVTIAGQTAPGGGICVAGASIYVCKPNVIIRYIRFRPGDVLKSNYQCLDVENTKNVIIDHCSMTWAVEECLTMYDCDSTTVQWSIIGEGLFSAGHSKGERSYAAQWGGEHSTMHHTLITNCYNRCPRFNGVRDEADLKNGHHNHDAQVVSEFTNNVIYNWGKQNSLYGGELDTTKNHDEYGRLLGYDHIYMLSNYFRPGPTTRVKLSSTSKYRFVVPSSQKGFGSWLLDGNRYSIDHAANQDNYKDWNVQHPRLDTLYTSLLEVVSAEQAYQEVVTGAGASLPRYDEEDTRLLSEAAGLQEPQFVGTAQPSYMGIIDSQADIDFAHRDTFVVAGDTITSYPYIGLLPGEQKAEDTDGDGMPDAWETEHALNPNDASDGAACTLSQLPGYTNLEYFLNGGDGELAEQIADAPELPILQALTALRAARADRMASVIVEKGRLYVVRDGRRYAISGQRY